MESTRLDEALHYFNLGRHEQALSLMTGLLADEPNNGWLLYIAAESYYFTNQYQDAEKYAFESLEKGYSVETCNYLLGRIYKEVEQFAKSEKCFLEALRLNPNHASALAAYGSLMLQTGHEKKAKQLIEEAMKIAPEDATVLRYRLMYFMYKDNKAEQVNALEKYMQGSSAEVSKFLNLGVYHLHNNHYKLARENFRQAFLLDPTNQNVLEILEQLDRQCHFVFLPNRIVEKVGAAVIWVSFIITIWLLNFLKQDRLLGAIALFYIVFAVYTWISPLLYRLLNTFKRN